MEIKGWEATYLMGEVEPQRSSVLTSNSRYLNNPRLRDVYAQMGLKRNGTDLPATFLIPEINRAIAEEFDMAEIAALISTERARLPEFAAWLDACFVSDWTLEKVAHCPPGSLGAAIYAFISGSGMNIDFMFRGAAGDDYTYLTKRRVQNHDIEHILTGFDTSDVGEIALIVANCIAIYRYFSPELAHALTFQTMFLTSTSVMRMACHYPSVVPAMLEGIALGVAMGNRQQRPIFMTRWEDWIDTPIEEVRRANQLDGGPPPGSWDWIKEATYG